MSLSKTVVRANCAEIIHPWSESCPDAYWKMICSSAQGSFKLFFPFLLASLGLKVYKKKKLDGKITREFLIDYFRCIMTGISVTTSIVLFNCLFRCLLGKYTYSTIVFIPTIFTGFSIFICDSTRRHVMATAISNTALESIVMYLAQSGLLPLNAYTETFFFMVINACLMYAVRITKSNPSNYTWFFKPDKDDNISDENGKLITEKLFKKTRTYFTFGLVFGILRTLIKDITVMKPKNIHKLFTVKTIKLGLFTGLYVAVYECIIYCLNRCFKRNRSAIFAWPAGFLAGLTYAIEPSLPINVSVLINLIQILYNRIDVQPLKLVPMDNIWFGLSLAVLSHIKIFHPKDIPKIGYKIIAMTTSGKSEIIAEAINKLNNIV